MVIAILAAISIVPYNGVQQRALRSSRLNEVTQVLKLFELYKAANGTYPDVPKSLDGTGYCVGGTYPNDYCRDTNGSTFGYPASNTALSDKLATVGSISANGRKRVASVGGWGGTVGVYVVYYLDKIDVVQVFDGKSTSYCPDYENSRWSNGTDLVLCGKTLSY